MTKNYAATYHRPSQREAARWLALATVAKQVADGSSRDLIELGRLAAACCVTTGEATTVFGHLVPESPCVRLLASAQAHAAISFEAAPVKEREFTRLRDFAEAVLLLHQEWAVAR